MSIKPITGSLFHFLYLIVCLSIVSITACNQAPATAKENESVTNTTHAVTIRLATVKSPPSWLIHIAKSNGFFQQQGLNIDSKIHRSGKRALKSLFQGDADLATTAEGPVVFYSLIRQDFSIISTIGISSNDNLIVARKDSGIFSPADLKGKAIATQSASSAHFYLHLFLTKNNFSEIDIIQSFMRIEKLPDAVVSGVADAIATREPFFSEAKTRLGENAITFETPGLYLKSFQLVGSNDYINDNPEIIKKFVAALLLAEQFVKNKKPQAIEILSSKFSLTNTQIMKTLRYLDLTISLEQSLIQKLEEEARWIIQSKLTASVVVPDFHDFIYTAALNNTRPAAMTIIKTK